MSILEKSGFAPFLKGLGLYKIMEQFLFHSFNSSNQYIWFFFFFLGGDPLQLITTLRVRSYITYFAENWKQCSKIIFKFVNSTVWPIFNESLVEKKDLWVSWTVHGTHCRQHPSAFEKRRRKRKTQT